MSNELLDIDETGEGKIDDSTIKIINLSRGWLIPLAVALFLLGGLSLFAVFMTLSNLYRAIDLEFVGLVMMFGALGIGALTSGVYIVRLPTLIKTLNQNPSSYRLNTVLRSVSRIFIIFSCAFVVASAAIVIMLSASIFRSGW